MDGLSVSESILERYNRLRDYVQQSPDVLGAPYKNKVAVCEACKRLDGVMREFVATAKSVEDELSLAESVMQENLKDWSLYIESYEGWINFLENQVKHM